MTASSNALEASSRPFLDEMSQFALGPVMLRRVFLILTRVHFSDPAHYGHFKKQLGNFVWSADDKVCTLRVNNDYIYDPKTTDTIPSIYVGVGDILFKKIAMDNHKNATPDRAGKEQIKTGTTQVILRHRTGKADECLRLAEQSFAYFNGIRPFLMQRMSLLDFEVEKILSTRPFARQPEQTDQQFIVDLVLTLSFNATWTTFIESHRIKTITFGAAVSTYLLDRDEPSTYPDEAPR